ncbi:MAG: transporter [Mycobacteriaceae bacterium]
MNVQTAVATYVFGFVIVALIAIVIRRMLGGWRARCERQAELIGALPAVPDLLGGSVVAPTPGLYIGSTLAGNWLERVVAGDLGYRCRAVLTRYPQGILLERLGAGPIWMANESVSSVRTERALAGKVLSIGGKAAGAPAAGLLVINWRLPSGTEIDTGFRGDGRCDYRQWIGTTGTTGASA